jgi:hypothetical protein
MTILTALNKEIILNEEKMYVNIGYYQKNCIFKSKITFII